jgi:hypothetical protein
MAGTGRFEGDVYRRHCKEQSDEAIYSIRVRRSMDCFASLAMTSYSRSVARFVTSGERKRERREHARGIKTARRNNRDPRNRPRARIRRGRKYSGEAKKDGKARISISSGKDRMTFDGAFEEPIEVQMNFATQFQQISRLRQTR